MGLSDAQEASPSTTEPSMFSFTSRSLEEGRPLPNLSPLTERSRLHLTREVENVAVGLAAFGYDVGYDRGLLQVSHPSQAKRPADAPTGLSIDTFMGALTRPRTQSSFRMRVGSSLTFSKATGSLARPQTAGGAPLTQPTSPHTPASPSQRPTTGAVRFARLAQSADSLAALKVTSPSTMPQANLIALTQPKLGSLVNGLKATPPPPPLAVPTAQVAATPAPATQAGQQPSPHPDDAPGGLLSPGAVQGEAHGAVPPPTAAARPSTPLIHLHKDASMSLRSAASSRPGTPSPQHPPGTAAAPSGRQIGGRPTTVRPRTAHGMAGFKPTRGQALIVFQDMDRDKNGKVTLSELEDSALAIGFTLEQARRLFDKLDGSRKGYLLSADWGRKEMAKVIEFFSHLYMCKFLGLPGPTATPEQIAKYNAMQRLKAARTLHAAINMARLNAVTRGAHASSGSGNVIYDAFSFIDTDRSGALSYDELRDGFYALGVHLTDDVMEQMMKFFDKSGDGSVDYYEFVQRMFPSASKGMR